MSSTENANYLLGRALQAGIVDRRELSNFMAQMQIESGGYARMSENLNYSGRRLLQVFPGRNGMDTAAEADAIAAGGPEAVANAIYGGAWGARNLGNTEPGDGWNFRGRGYVQLTGRANYERIGQALGIDLVNRPERAEDREIAARIAIHYWQSRVVPNGHQQDVRGATRDINGGENHLAEREAAAQTWARRFEQGYLREHGLDDMQREPRLQGTTVPAQGGIRDLQQSLNQLGVRDARGRTLVEDGDFGQRTREAVEAFQRANGLKVDGIAGPDTLTRIGQQLPDQGRVTATAEIARPVAAHSQTLADPGHPNHALYRQAYGGLQGIDPQQSGLRSEQELRNAAGTLAFEARVSGLTRIDHVVANRDGSGLFAVQGRIDDPSHHRVYVDREQAAAQPLERSTQQLEQETQQTQQREQQRDQQQRETRIVVV